MPYLMKDVVEFFIVGTGQLNVTLREEDSKWSRAAPCKSGTGEKAKICYCPQERNFYGNDSSSKPDHLCICPYLLDQNTSLDQIQECKKLPNGDYNCNFSSTEYSVQWGFKLRNFGEDQLVSFEEDATSKDTPKSCRGFQKPQETQQKDIPQAGDLKGGQQNHPASDNEFSGPSPLSY
jgi:hypothetical protein